MDGYQVIIDEIRRASGAAGDAAEIAAGVDLSAAITPVAGALAGSRSADSVGTVAPYWSVQVSTWSADVQSYSGSLSASADLYESNEARAADDLLGAG